MASTIEAPDTAANSVISDESVLSEAAEISTATILRLPPRPTVPGVAFDRTARQPVRIPSRRFVLIAIGLCTIALGISGYLAYTAFMQKKVAGCGGGDLIDCNHVLHSRWAKAYGVPVSVPALAMYTMTLVALGLSLTAIPRSVCWSNQSRLLWSVITVAAISAGLAAMWFIGLQIFAIGKYCPWCLGAHSCGLLLAIGILAKRPLGSSMTAKLSMLSVLGVSLLVGGQLMAGEPEAPKTMDDALDQGVIEIERFDTPVDDGTTDNFAPVDTPFDDFAPVDEAPVDAAPTDDMDMFAAPVGDGEFLPPTGEGDEEVFTPPGIEAEADVGLENDDNLVAPPSASVKEQEIFGGSDFELPEVPDRVAEEEIFGGALFCVEDDITQTQQNFLAQVITNSQPAPVQNSGTVIQSGTVTNGTIIPQQNSGTVIQGQGTVIQTTPSNGGSVIPQGTIIQQGTTTQQGSTTRINPAVTPKKTEKKAAPIDPKKRIVSLSGGRTRLNVHQWPLLGKPTARYIFVEMFDYTCPHCRETHKAIHEAMKMYGEDLAVVSLPVPLEMGCNSTVTVNRPQHYEACELAKTAIATWRVNREKFSEFHCWLFEKKRTAFEAKAHARKLVGAQKFDTEMSKTIASQYIAKHVELYKRAGKGAVPKLLFPNSTVVGQVTSASLLDSLIKKELR